ncbi:hypothetical protein [Myceligenerans xiligouense]|uniref:Uncharacterized protein n=1 Tax=Myceligenerans xiligouense TaxID=253184 RepID=A0A3N4Z1U2_9MICO|nr:hypothetical protein [Myceligenerans xiligouense]RPF19998.1 hypothetical protein EDD34_0573 [Myceligenerans xiligouense]
MNDAHRPLQALSVEVQAFTDLINDVEGKDRGTPTPAPGWSVRHQAAPHPADLDLEGGNDHVRDRMSAAQEYRGDGGPGRQPSGQVATS